MFAQNTLRAEQLHAELKFFQQYTPDLNRTIHLFPDWQTLPYDYLSPEETVRAQRILTLRHLLSAPSAGQTTIQASQNLTVKTVITRNEINQEHTHNLKSEGSIYVIPIHTLLYPTAMPKHILQHSFHFKKGAKLSVATLTQHITKAGYHAVHQVIVPGEFVVRGGQIDLFPMGNQQPIRIELFDNSIDTIRIFDPNNQRNLDCCDEFKLVPAYEFPFNAASIQHFRQQWRLFFSGNPLEVPLYQSISQQQSFPGIESYLPLFFDKAYHVIDFFPDNSLIIRNTETDSLLRKHLEDISDRYEQLRHDQKRPILPPEHLFLSTEKFFKNLKKFDCMRYTINADATNTTIQPLSDITISQSNYSPLEQLKILQHNLKQPRIIVLDSNGRKEILEKTFQKHDIHSYSLLANTYPKKPAYYLCVGQLFESISIPNHLDFLSEYDLLSKSKDPTKT